jgi:hypothetical protein
MSIRRDASLRTENKKINEEQRGGHDDDGDGVMSQVIPLGGSSSIQ